MSHDIISELPESLLTHILSYLPTKDSVKTSVLSKQWEFLWLRVPALDLEFDSFHQEDLTPFIDGFLERNRDSRLHKFIISYDQHSGDRFSEWIATAVDRGVQHLAVETDMEPHCKDLMPLNIFKSNTLVSLELVRIEIESEILPFVVSLPCLKTMRFEDNWTGEDPLFLEKIISGCPVLEDLTLIRPNDYYVEDFVTSLSVRSQSLKRFRLRFEHIGMRGRDFSLKIEAPKLEYLSFKDNQSDKILLKNLSLLSTVEIDTKFNIIYGGSPLDPEDLRKRNLICRFLNGISTVRHMIISQRTLEVLYRYSKLGTIPKFDSLLRLEATFPTTMLRFLPVFLESCPNLKTLIVDFVVSAEPEQTELTYAPPCLSMNLECVEIKGLSTKGETWKQLAKYFLENSAVLNKFVLRFEDTTNEDSDISKEFLTYQKLSRRCQIIIH